MIGVAKALSGGANQAAEFLYDSTPMSHRFVVKLDEGKYDLGSWSKVAGLTVRWAKVGYRAGDDSHETILPGNRSHEPIKLSRAACADSSTVQKWLAKTTKRAKPFPGALHLVDFIGLPVVTWEFRELFPIAWSISDFDAAAGNPIIETLELAHSGFLDDEAKVTGS